MPRRPITTALLTLACAAAMPACSSSPEPGTRAAEARPARTVTLNDFADPNATAPVVVQTSGPALRVPAGGFQSSVGAPTLADGAGATGERITIDAVVGQINGAPVYAEEFFRDSERRWREQSRRQSPRAWTEELQEYTNARLFNIVRDELLLGEFRASLNAAQRQGVLAFVENLREQRISEAQGSEQIAIARSLEEEGIDLDTAVQREAEREFVLTQLRQSIGRRVQVSSRDIELYYRRNIAKYQPLPVATVRMITIDADDPERLAEVNAILESGDIPEDLGSTSDYPLEEGGMRAFSPYSVDALNDAVRPLRAGQHSAPVLIGERVRILRLDAVSSPEHRTLYDAQLEIEQAIRTERLLEEEQRYFLRLLERSNVSEMNDMLVRLLTYATERFWEGPRGEG